MNGAPAASESVTPRGSRVLAVILALISVGGFAVSVVQSPGASLLLLPLHLLLLWVAWAVLWNPHVRVYDERVVLVNITREHDIPLGSVEDVDTRWGLMVTANGRRYQAWAAPAPGTLHTMRFRPDDLKDLPESSYVEGTLRPGDDPVTDSGVAALHIRRRLERGDDTAGGEVRSRWNIASLVTGAILLVATVLSLQAF